MTKRVNPKDEICINPDCRTPYPSYYSGRAGYCTRECANSYRAKIEAASFKSFEPQAVQFAEGPVGRPLDDLRNNPRYNERRQRGEPIESKDGKAFLSPVRVAVLDIETTGLNAGFGVVLCAVVKMYSPDERFIFRADDYPAWKSGERANDKELLSNILACMEDADVLIAHNGLKFDLPFLRTRAVIHGLPPVNFQKIIDPVQLARTHFRFPGNGLDSISRVIGTKAEKSPLRPEIWQRATMNGDKDAMDEIVAHCVLDVEVLEEVCWKIRGYVKKIDGAGSFR